MPLESSWSVTNATDNINLGYAKAKAKAMIYLKYRCHHSWRLLHDDNKKFFAQATGMNYNQKSYVA